MQGQNIASNCQEHMSRLNITISRGRSIANVQTQQMWFSSGPCMQYDAVLDLPTAAVSQLYRAYSYIMPTSYAVYSTASRRLLVFQQVRPAIHHRYS